ncbi:MAG: glycosyltransferase family A protein [Candidatus Falkowbacteria bacterium]
MVDVVIPIKKEKNYYWDLLPRAIDSVLKQTFTDFRLIVQLYDKDVATGRNEAIRGSDSEYCLTLDADDWLEPDYLEKTVPLMERYDIVGTGGDINGRYFEPMSGSLDDFLQANRILNCSLFKRKVWESHNFDETLGGYEDYEFNIKALRNGYKVGVINQKLVNISDYPNSRNKGAMARHNELKEKICRQ